MIGKGLNAVTILPRNMEYFIDSHIDNKKLRIVNKLLILTCVIACLFIIRPASANLLTFLGYDYDKTVAFKNILLGKYAKKTLDFCFNKSMLEFVSGNQLSVTISNAMSGIGIFIAFIQMMAKGIEYIQTGQLTSERLASVLVQFAIPFVLIFNITMVTDAISTFGGFVLEKGKTALENYEQTPEDFDKDEIIDSYTDYINGTSYQQEKKNEMISEFTTNLANCADMESYIGGHINDVIGDLNQVDDDNDYEGLGENIDDVYNSLTDKQRNKIDSAVYYKLTNGTDREDVSGFSEIEKQAYDNAYSIRLQMQGIVDQNIEDATSTGSIISSSLGLDDVLSSGIRLLTEALVKGITQLIIIAMIIMDIAIRFSIMVACFGIYGRLIIYQAFLPIGISDVSGEGSRSTGMRIIKLFFGLYIEILMFYVINSTFWVIFNNMLARTVTFAEMITCFLACGAGIRASFKSARGLTETVLGVK